MNELKPGNYGTKYLEFYNEEVLADKLNIDSHEVLKYMGVLAKSFESAPRFALQSVGLGPGPELGWTIPMIHVANEEFESSIHMPFTVTNFEMKTLGGTKLIASCVSLEHAIAEGHPAVTWGDNIPDNARNVELTRFVCWAAYQSEHTKSNSWFPCLGVHWVENVIEDGRLRVGTRRLFNNVDSVIPMTEENREASDQYHAVMLAAIMQTLILLSCNNVKTVRTEEPVKLNAKRAKSGKPPFVSYHILDVPGHETSDAELGGTHASPRFHLRRGHVRRLPTGVSTWVRHCAVGSPANGMVKKDYRVTA